jgi:hypothetical protein
MRTLAPWLVLFGGCDLALGLEKPLPDGPPPSLHDEDRDGTTDDIDTCPHVYEAVQRDTDLDGVGDACDPEPAIKRQSLVTFKPMTGGDGLTSTVDGGAWTRVPDAWRYDGTNYGNLFFPLGAENIDLDVAIVIQQVTAAPAQLSIAIKPDCDATTFLYGELYDDIFQYVAINSAPEFDTLEEVSLPDGIRTGKLTARLTARNATGRPAPQLVLDAGWETERYTVAAPVHASGACVGLTLWHVRADVEYIALISTGAAE